MVMVGIDVHKQTHTAVAASCAGMKLAELKVATTATDFEKLIGWAREVAAEVGDGEVLLWAVEDCRTYSQSLEAALLVQGFTVVRVPPHLSAGTRKTGRVGGKSDPVDALAVARVALREPDLPVAVDDPTRRAIKMLADDRDRLVVERTAAINQLRAILHVLDRGLEPAGRGISATALIRLRYQLAGAARNKTMGVDQVAAIKVARRIIARLIELTDQIAAAGKELDQMSLAVAPALRQIPGCAAVTSARIIAEVGDVSRFRSSDAFAMYAGTAPIEVSSGKSSRHRLARGGNRKLNATIHVIALTQTRLQGPGRDYYQSCLDRGKSRKEALRILKRKIARTIYNNLNRHTQTPSQSLAA